MPSLTSSPSPNRRRESVPELVDHLFRHKAGQMISALTHYFGIENLKLVEDIVQDSLLKALQQGRTLSEAIQESLAASVDGVSRLQQWFAEWATVGWFCHPPADSAEA